MRLLLISIWMVGCTFLGYSTLYAQAKKKPEPMVVLPNQKKSPQTSPGNTKEPPAAKNVKGTAVKNAKDSLVKTKDTVVKRKDSVTVVQWPYPQTTQPAQKTVKPANPVSPVTAADMKETVTVIKIQDTNKKKPVPEFKDTVIILRKGKTPAQVAAEKKRDTIITNNPSTAYCSCLKMDIKAQDELGYEQYINYSFIFKNDCKMQVWISSQHFRFVPMNAFDKPVKVLRKLSFVKRYDYPEFVRLEPGETYTFSYADDPFFEYDLQKGESYKFYFEHRNFGTKAKQDPSHTYLCYQKRMHLVQVK